MGQKSPPRGVQMGLGAPKIVIRTPRWAPRQELRPPRGDSRAARCPPRGREGILGRFLGAQRVPETGPIWDFEPGQNGGAFSERFGGRFWSVWGFQNVQFEAPKAARKARQGQHARRRK